MWALLCLSWGYDAMSSSLACTCLSTVLADLGLRNKLCCRAQQAWLVAHRSTGRGSGLVHETAFNQRCPGCNRRSHRCLCSLPDDLPGSEYDSDVPAALVINLHSVKSMTGWTTGASGGQMANCHSSCKRRQLCLAAADCVF